MKEKKPKVNKVLIAFLSLMIIGVCSYGGFYFYKSDGNANKKIEQAYIDIGDVVVKLSDEDGKRYLKINMSVGFDKNDKKVKKQLRKSEQLPVVQDALYFYLMSKSSDFFKGDYETKLKSGLIDAINEKIQGFKITDIKISNLIIQ